MKNNNFLLNVGLVVFGVISILSFIAMIVSISIYVYKKDSNDIQNEKDKTKELLNKLLIISIISGCVSIFSVVPFGFLIFYINRERDLLKNNN